MKRFFSLYRLMRATRAPVSVSIVWAVWSLLAAPPRTAYAAKSSGIGMTVTIDDADGTGRDITNDITSVSFNTPRGVQDVTGLDKSALERLLLLIDFNMTVTAVFNPAANPSMFGVFSTPADNDTRTVVIVVGGKTMTAECVMTDVSWSRNADGSFTAQATFILANGTAPAWS